MLETIYTPYTVLTIVLVADAIALWYFMRLANRYGG